MQNSLIEVKGPVVYFDGDEQAQVMMGMIWKKLLNPNLRFHALHRHDLSMISRRDKGNRAVMDAACAALVEHRIGVKCAGITPNAARKKEFGLAQIDGSPNAELRKAMLGTALRAPILHPKIPVKIIGWKDPLVIARMAIRDEYESRTIVFPKASRLTITVTDAAGNSQTAVVANTEGGGVFMGMFNTDTDIINFARATFNAGLKMKLPVYSGFKETAIKGYDEKFVEIFADIYEREFKADFEAVGIFYQHKLIDDLVAFMINNRGGFIAAMKNLMGDVFSDMTAAGFGSLGMMTSGISSPDGNIFLSEAAHGTVTAHYRLHQQGKPTSTNSIASIFAWTRGLIRRGEEDATGNLVDFGRAVEQAVMNCLTKERMTKDLVLLRNPNATDGWLTTEGFIDAVAEELRALSA